MAWDFVAQDEGPRKLAIAIYRAAEGIGAERIIIDGIRQPETLKELKKLAKKRVTVLFVHTPPDVAYEFYTGREENSMSALDFYRILGANVERDIRTIISDSDAVLYNRMGLGALAEAVEGVILTPVD